MRSDGFGALRLVFDDRKLGFVTNVYWFHRRYAGEYEPRPQQPRGWYVFGGYDAQRAVERTPGVSQPESQIKDTAALFFFEDAAGGGQSGFLSPCGEGSVICTSGLSTTNACHTRATSSLGNQQAAVLSAM